MGNMTFIVDCHRCRAKVAALEAGRAERTGQEEESLEPWGERVHVGECPRCGAILVGESTQLGFEGLNADEDRWSDVVRVFPKPAKAFSSYRIPRVVKESLLEVDRSLQANANVAACAMCGRALEAICQDALEGPKETTVIDEANTQSPKKEKKRITLREGIELLRTKKVIDDRLYDWSQHLRGFRNLAAHAQDEVTISREDAEDLQTFVYAIVEYVYDLTDRYEEFKARVSARQKSK